MTIHRIVDCFAFQEQVLAPAGGEKLGTLICRESDVECVWSCGQLIEDIADANLQTHALNKRNSVFHVQ